MKKPDWRYHPVYLMLLFVALASLPASSLIGRWRAGTWTPSLRDLAYGLAGFVLSAALLIPGYFRLRREGDAYIRRIMVPKPRPQLRLRNFLWAALGALTAEFTRYWGPRDLHYCFYVGVGLGMVTWYPRLRATWRRMWELYEQDQSAALAVAPPVSSAPEAR